MYVNQLMTFRELEMVETTSVGGALVPLTLQDAMNPPNQRRQFVYENGSIFCNAKRRSELDGELYTLQYDARRNVRCGPAKGQPQEKMNFIYRFPDQDDVRYIFFFFNVYVGQYL